MIGRFLGAISMSDINNAVKKYSMMFVVAIVVFLLIYTVVWIESDFNFSLNSVLPFIAFIVINFIAFILGKSLPARTLMIFALINVILLIIAMNSTGQIALWSLLSIGLFNSIMWSNIFTLAIDGLGKYTSQGSSLLVMMILGGAVIPVIQGVVADKLGVHSSFLVPILSYFYLVYYGWKGFKKGKWKFN